MTNYSVRAGVDTYVLYDEETSYGTAPSSFSKTLGIVTRFGATPKRNLQKIRGMMGVLPASNQTTTHRDPLHILRGKFEGTMTVDFIPLDFGILEYVMGTSSGSGTESSPYNYPQATATADADKRKYLKIPSISFVTNYMFDGSADSANKCWKYLGGGINDFTLEGSFGEVVTASISAPFSNMTGSSGVATPVAIGTNEPFNFTGVTLEIPTGSGITNIFEDFSLKISNTVEILYGMGTDGDIGKQMIVKDREVTLDVTLNAEGTKYIDYFMGGASTLSAPTEISSITLTLTGDTNKVLTAVLLRCKIDDPNRDNSYPNVVKEKFTIHPEVVYFTEQVSA